MDQTGGDDDPIPGPSPETLLALRLIPKVGGPLAQYLIDRHERRAARAAELVSVAAETSDMTPEELIEAVCSNERLSDLLNDALAAATRYGLEEKRRALGRVFAQAIVGDDAAVDESAMLISALAPLEPVHVRLMATLYLGPLEDGAEPSTLSSRRDFLSHEEGIEEDVVEAALLQLQAWGLTSSGVDLKHVFTKLTGPGSKIIQPWDSEPKYGLTKHGLKLIQLLKEP